MSNLVIVESPAKAKTIKKYLGKDYEVVASMGHIRDLPKSKMGIDIENNFEPVYTNIKDKNELIESLIKQAEKSDKIYLATDPDREGEAISWHLSHILGLDLNEANRVTFNEITEKGVKSGMSVPRAIDSDLVNAQQARRILDRLLGYKLSPFLWKKIRRGLSAGRVQSVAVRLIVDREEEIKAFKTDEYWSIDAKLSVKNGKKSFKSKLLNKLGKKIKIKNKDEADQILNEIKNHQFIVAKVTKKERKVSPAPPFITSTLQQEASRKLNFQAFRTMKAAQELYEGVDIKDMGAVGLITYMRTDSLRISDEAKEAAVNYIKNKYGENYLPPSPRVYKSKSNSQDAHEAIRPSLPEITPEQVKENLSTDQYKLYKLIWNRFMASQMADQILDTVSADINAGDYLFRSTGSTVKFKGFSELYVESLDTDEEEKQSLLPELHLSDVLNVDEIKGNQHFTEPPPRYTEATLIKMLEEKGIGRPSTYAPTILTVVRRSYVEREAKQLKPTVLGEVTTKLMKDHFPQVIDIEFTGDMESNLDKIESGKIEWKQTVSRFYEDFEKELLKAEKETEGTRVKIPDEETEFVCENCGKPMVIKHGRFGKFIACTGYPECKTTKKIVKETSGICPLCNGKMLEKKSTKGKKYFGCENNPKCGFMTWDEPIDDKCPNCGSGLLKKKGKAGKIYCSKEECGYVKTEKDNINE